jgi:carboxylesterase type B
MFSHVFTAFQGLQADAVVVAINYRLNVFLPALDLACKQNA